jgi:hypothetical protein
MLSRPARRSAPMARARREAIARGRRSRGAETGGVTRTEVLAGACGHGRLHLRSSRTGLRTGLVVSASGVAVGFARRVLDGEEPHL